MHNGAPRKRCRTSQEEEEFITSGNWRGKHNSLSHVAGADQPERETFVASRTMTSTMPLFEEE